MTEWNAGDYSRQSSLQESLALERLADLKIKGTERVLDIGCGDGKVTARIAAALPGGSVLGTDVSHRMVAFAAEHFGPPEYANLQFKFADVCSLPYRDEFDLILSFNALHWVRDQDAAIRAIGQALRPDGKAILQFVPAGPHRSLERVIENVCQSPRWIEYFGTQTDPFVHLTPAEYREVVERNGLTVCQLRREERSWDFQTREAFSGFCRATFVEWLRLVPETLHETFIHDVLDHYQQEAPPGLRSDHMFTFYQLKAVLAKDPSCCGSDGQAGGDQLDDSIRPCLPARRPVENLTA